MITSHPQNVVILQGHKVTLEVTAYGTMPLFYQWYYEDDILHGMLHHIVHMTITSCFTGEIKSFYSIYPVTIRNAGRYYCQVKNLYGAVNSENATMIVSTSSTANIPSALPGCTHSPLPVEQLAHVLSNKGSQIQDSTSADLS